MTNIEIEQSLTLTVQVSFLPVGHTHEDIDAVFALIWTYLMTHKVLTPEQYEQLLLLAVQGREEQAELFDLWAIPAYDDYFSKYRTCRSTVI